MKVLQVTNSLMSGGAEKLVVDTSIRYKQRGIDVDILLLDGTRTPFFESLDDHKDIKIISLGNTANIYRPSNIFKIKKYLNEYDIIHVHLFPALYWVGIANFLKRKKHTVVVTEHNTTNRRRKLLAFKLLDRFVYKQFDKIITISNAVDESLKSHLGKRFQNYTKIYNGINLKVIEEAVPYPKSELGYSNDDILLIQVASFTAQKDQGTAIKAMLDLPKSYKLLLVGKGPLKEQYIQQVKELDLEDRVEFLGVRSDVPRLLKSVDLVLLSSHYEGLSLSSVEGMASGKPFIATNAPGLTEVVEGAGVLFKDQDHKELLVKIKELIDQPDYYKEVVINCVERSKQFDIELMVGNYIKLYKSNR